MIRAMYEIIDDFWSDGLWGKLVVVAMLASLMVIGWMLLTAVDHAMGYQQNERVRVVGRDFVPAHCVTISDGKTSTIQCFPDKWYVSVTTGSTDSVSCQVSEKLHDEVQNGVEMQALVTYGGLFGGAYCDNLERLRNEP